MNWPKSALTSPWRTISLKASGMGLAAFNSSTPSIRTWSRPLFTASMPDPECRRPNS